MALATAVMASSCPTTRWCKLVFHQQQLVFFALQHLGHRDAGGAADHLGNFFGADHGAQQLRAATVLGALGLAGLLGLRVFQLFFQHRQLAVAQLGQPC